MAINHIDKKKQPIAAEQGTKCTVGIDTCIVFRYVYAMIVGFRNKQTEGLFLRRDARHFPADVIERARRKLMALDAAIGLDDLRVPPSNRLEALKGSRAGQHSMRVNDQWRICFVWKDGNADQVEFCDYH